MNNLIIDNHVIQKEIKPILNKLRLEITDGKLRSIRYMGDNVRVTCPFHKNGLENRPSCDIYVGNDDSLNWGTYHCFTCGSKGSLIEFVAECLNISTNQAKKWLKDNFTDYRVETSSCVIDDSINLKKNIKQKVTNNNLEEKLEKMQSWHPYLQTRKLSKEVCNRFDVKYDPKTECIVFPVRDLSGKIVFFTRRSVNSKQFIIDSNITKDIYLLYNMLQEGTKTLYIAESQINALTLQSWGYPAVALMGTGTKYQYELLKKANILHYVLCFDGDEAGRKGTINFIKNLGENSFITIKALPEGKDVNDLTKEQFDNLDIYE